MAGRKALWSAIGMGAAYLMRNKSARDKVISQVRRVATSIRDKKNTNTSNSNSNNNTNNNNY